VKVAIRADASTRIGTGHVMRCITLAEELRRRGADVLFICRKHPVNLCRLINAKGFRVVCLATRDVVVSETLAAPLDHMVYSADDRPPGYDHRLGLEWRRDATQTAETIDDIGGVDWIVVDHYGLDARWESRIREAASRVMVIDDLAARPHDCDLLLDQNFVDHYETRYESLVPEGARLLLGARYALLRREFLAALDRPKRLWNRGPLRLFVFFGGTDPTNETSKALRALDRVSHEVCGDVVVGAGNPQRDELASWCGSRSLDFHCQTENMAELMSSADVALCAGGSTTWERCILGLPAIVVAVAENQVSVTRAVSVAGAQIDLGWYEDVDEGHLIEAVERLVRAPQLLEEMSVAGRALMGGRNFLGVGGVVEAMLQ
jgi:UDP-2,4-diacetamido-2,4,6-trideoxy-beta-L-altropyranose hydrolase